MQTALGQSKRSFAIGILKIPIKRKLFDDAVNLAFIFRIVVGLRIVIKAANEKSTFKERKNVFGVKSQFTESSKDISASVDH